MSLSYVKTAQLSKHNMVIYGRVWHMLNWFRGANLGFLRLYSVLFGFLGLLSVEEMSSA